MEQESIGKIDKKEFDFIVSQIGKIKRELRLLEDGVLLNNKRLIKVWEELGTLQTECWYLVEEVVK